MITTTWIKPGLIVITENVDGETYILTADTLEEVITEWYGDCNGLPANDAKVYYAQLDYEEAPCNICEFEPMLRYFADRRSIRVEDYEIDEMRMCVMHTFIGNEHEILTTPLTRSQVSGMPDLKISGVIEIELSDVINHTTDEFLDILEGKLVEECLIIQMSYDLVGISDRNTILLYVCADIEDDFSVEN